MLRNRAEESALFLFFQSNRLAFSMTCSKIGGKQEKKNDLRMLLKAKKQKAKQR